jgi:hypothetical protein
MDGRSPVIVILVATPKSYFIHHALLRRSLWGQHKILDNLYVESLYRGHTHMILLYMNEQKNKSHTNSHIQRPCGALLQSFAKIHQD